MEMCALAEKAGLFNQIACKGVTMEIDVKPWEWMVKPTPQTEWITSHGMLIWLAFFFVELGAGMYFVSIFLDNMWGMFIGWLMLPLLGGGLLFLHIGKKMRVLLMISNFKRSWISRGFVFIGINTVLGAVHNGPGRVHR